MEFWEFLETYSGAFIVLLTGALVFTTIVYVVVSMKLLKQSKNALLADMVLRIMETYRSETKDIAERETGGPVLEGWTEGYYKAFVEIDKKLGMDLANVSLVGFKAALRYWGEWARKEREKEEKLDRKIKELEGEKEKLEKLFKKIKDLEHPKNQ